MIKVNKPEEVFDANAEKDDVIPQSAKKLLPAELVGYNWEHSVDPKEPKIKIARNNVTGREFRGTKEEFRNLLMGI